MDPEDFQTDSEPEESYLPEGLGSDVDQHGISSSEESGGDDDGTPKMSPDPEFDPAAQDLGALIAQGEMDPSEAGPSVLTSSFLSMPENLRQQDLHVKKTPGVKEPKGKGKKRTKRKAKGGEKDGEPTKKKKKKSKKEGKKTKEDKEKEKRKEDRTKRRNIKTFLRQDELEEETLKAQQEEAERKKRLEEQRALNADLATLSELLSDDVPTQPSQSTPFPPPSSSSQPPPSGLFPALQPSSQPPSSSAHFTRGPPPLASLNRMPLPVPVLTPQIQSQMMRQFPSSSFRSFSNMPPLMPGLSQFFPKPKPPPKTVDGYIVLDDSSGDEESDKKKASGREDDVIDISSGDEDITVVSDEDKEEQPMQDEYDDEGDDESSGVHSNDSLNVPDAYGRVLVNVGHPPDEPDIFLADHLSGIVKCHQIGGIRFLYDNLVESVNRFRASQGFGCILAHSMGLGKTLQLISFTDIFMRHTGAKTVLCIVPINTLQNWVAEFERWLPARTKDCEGDKSSEKAGDSSQNNDGSSNGHDSGETQRTRRTWRQFRIFVVNDMHKTTDSRLNVIDEWYTEGGVLLMGYEMYRLLCSRKTTRARKKAPTARRKTQVIDLEEEDRKEGMIMDIRRALVRPGPDLVICDEGHRIKNSLAGISQALKNIRTRRRVVLTGYPLQNNLQEYWCMVDFVRPNFLGTKHEFANLFERPISNGQCMDSTPNDVRLMQHRAHVLHKLLEGFVQRRGFKVLRTALPHKEEHVLMVRLTTFQRGLYIRFMQRFTEAGAAGWCSTNPLKAFSVACKIWNHPDVLCEVLQKRESLDTDTDLDLPEFNPKSKGGKKKGSSKDKDSTSANGSCESGKSSPSMDLLAAAGAACSKSSAPISMESYQDKVNEILSFEWARDLMKNYQQNKISNSSKMVLLFKILEDSIKVGDKILVFSQSLMTLTVIENFLERTPIPQPDDPPADMPTEWIRNSTYFRLDGSTPVSERERMINEFNAPNSQFWLFLLSTRAGSLGINLIGANRVVVLDASWNPCHDAQAVCRVYRYGQKKPCHVYRMVTDNTLEKKIYDRQISKKGMSDRVVDELNPEMNLTKKEVESLLEFDESDMPYEDFSHMADKFSDPILKDICAQYSNALSKAPFTTESLLCDRRDTRLTRAEKRQAESNFEAEKKLNLSYSRPSYAAYYAQGAKSRVNIDANAAAHASSLPSSFMSRYTANRPVANVRPIQSTPVPKTPMNNMQQRLLELRNAGVTVQKITATTDIILPGTNTTTTSNPLIRAGEQVTFIKTQKGVYLRTTDGRILAVRGAQQPSKSTASSSSSSDGLSLDPGLAATFSTAQFPSDTLTTQSGDTASSTSSSSSHGNQARHQLADLLREKVPTSGDAIHLSSDSDADSDFFDPFKSPHKTPRKFGGRPDLGRSDGSSPSGFAKPATCTVSPGVQSVPLASTLPLGPFGSQSRQSGSPLSQPNASPSDDNNPTSSSSSTTNSEPIVSAPGLLNQMSDLHLPNVTVSNSQGSTQSAMSTEPSTTTSTTCTSQTTSANPPTTSNMPTTMQQPMPTASSYGMPYFPGMVPMPSTGNSQQQQQQQQQQQPPIVINYQLPMPPGTMMQPGFMPFGFPPMMFPGGAPPGGSGQQNQGGQYQGGMYPGMGGQMQGPGQMPMGQGQYPMGQGDQNQGQNGQVQSQSNQAQPPVSSSDVLNQKIADNADLGEQSSSTTNA